MEKSATAELGDYDKNQPNIFVHDRGRPFTHHLFFVQVRFSLFRESSTLVDNKKKKNAIQISCRACAFGIAAYLLFLFPFSPHHGWRSYSSTLGDRRRRFGRRRDRAKPVRRHGVLRWCRLERGLV
jgi:hypothetical protein